MSRQTTDTMRIPATQDVYDFSLHMFPGLPVTYGGPERQIELIDKIPPKKNKRCKLKKIVKSLRQIAKKAQVDYRLSDLRKTMETILPKMIQQGKEGTTNPYNSSEVKTLQHVLAIGNTLIQNGKDLSRVDRKLADILTELGKALQGIA